MSATMTQKTLFSNDGKRGNYGNTLLNNKGLGITLMQQLLLLNSDLG